MNIHELAAITHNKIPVKIFIMNNHGYLAIRTTQKIFFNKRLIGEGPETGVSFPNTEKIAQAYGLKYFCIEFKKDLHKTIKRVLTCKGAVICDCILPYWQDHITVSSKELETGKIVSLPIDDMYPYLSDEDKLSIKSI